MITREEVKEGAFILHNVLSSQRCQDFIELSEKEGYSEATVYTGKSHQMIKSVRDNMRVIMDDHDCASKIWRDVSQFFMETIEGMQAYGLNERFRFYRYSDGQPFKMHRDGPFERSESDRSFYTFIIYLNDDYEGGGTGFREGPIVQPTTGSALVFLHPCRHEGLPVTSGTKYAIRSDVMYRSKR